MPWPVSWLALLRLLLLVRLSFLLLLWPVLLLVWLSSLLLRLVLWLVLRWVWRLLVLFVPGLVWLLRWVRCVPCRTAEQIVEIKWSS